MSDVEIYTTTSKHFSFFREYCQDFINCFGLFEYRVFFEHRACQSSNSLAEIAVSLQGRAATIVLSDKWSNIFPSEENLRRSAFHEVCELLFSEMRCVAGDIDLGLEAREQLTTRACHSIIRRLERAVLPRLPFLIIEE
jgi:hypothetical protein